MSVQKFLTPAELAQQKLDEEYKARQEVLAKQYGEEVQGGDRQLESVHQHNYNPASDGKDKNFDQKIYLFPPSFNALRKELHENWPTLFYGTPTQAGTTVAHAMAFDGPHFVAALNEALDMDVQFDTDNVSGICHTFLNALRKKRGLSELSS